MVTGGAAAAPDSSPTELFSIPGRASWRMIALFTMAALAYFSVGLGSYSLLSPHEARHAGIVHEMWAARHYLMPRIDGVPVLDGAPLYYWLSAGFVSVFGVGEWVLRLPSALSAALLLAVATQALHRYLSSRVFFALFALSLIQPSLVMAGRFAAPDMLNASLLAVALGGFLRAAFQWERGKDAQPWLLAAWIGTGLLGLGAGPLAIFTPLLVVGVWLLARRRRDTFKALCWWPAMLAGACIVLPWLGLVAHRYPGIVPAMLEKQFFGLLGHGHDGWGRNELQLRAMLLLLACLPVALTLYQYRDAQRRASLHGPLAGFMAVWLVVLVPLHPLLAPTVAGPAAVIVVPLLYFSGHALAFGVQASRSQARCAWGAYIAATALASMVAVAFFVPRLSAVPPVARAISSQYRSTTDKVIMLDRYDYEFNFYLSSPKLVFIATDWTLDPERPGAGWQQDFTHAAAFASQTAERMLLTHEQFVERLCERRVVNLWVVGSDASLERHPILSDLTPIVAEGTVRAWYLEAGGLFASQSCPGVRG